MSVFFMSTGFRIKIIQKGNCVVHSYQLRLGNHVAVWPDIDVATDTKKMIWDYFTSYFFVQKTQFF